MLAGYYVGKRDTNMAISLLDQYLGRVQTGPDHLKAKRFKAVTYFQEKKVADALRLVDEILEVNPGDLGAHRLKGDILANQGDFGGAIAEYRAVVHEEPENKVALLNLAKAHRANNELALAEDSYKKALEMDRTSKVARLALADIYRLKGELDSVKEQLGKILETAPDDRQALALLGDVALAEKDVKAAREYFRKVLVLEPKAPLAYYKNGRVELMDNKIKEATSLFEKALEINPAFGPALNQLLGMLVKEKKVDEAIDRCRQQIKKVPENDLYHVFLGNLYPLKGCTPHITLQTRENAG